MDHGYPLDPRVRALPPELSVAASRMASFLGAGGRAIVLTGPPDSGKTALMEHLLSGLSGLVTRVRGGADGADRPPLDVVAMLRQMGEPAPEEGDETGQFLRTLAVAAYDEYSAVLAVDDAHALSPEALQVLARVPGLGGPGLGGSATPGMVLVLVGELSLLEQLDAPGLEVFGDARRTLIVRDPSSLRPARAGTAWQRQVPRPAPVPGHAFVPGQARRAGARGRWLARNRRDLGLVAIALVTGAALATLWLTWPEGRSLPPPVQRADIASEAVPSVAPVPSPVPSPVPPIVVVPFETPQAAVSPPPAVQETEAPAPTAAAPSPAPSETVPAPDTASAPAPGPPPEPARPRAGEAQLRREFDAFLNRAGPDTAKLTPASRAALWREFLEWRARRHAAAGGVPRA